MFDGAKTQTGRKAVADAYWLRALIEQAAGDNDAALAALESSIARCDDGDTEWPWLRARAQAERVSILAMTARLSEARSAGQAFVADYRDTSDPRISEALALIQDLDTGGSSIV